MHILRCHPEPRNEKTPGICSIIAYSALPPRAHFWGEFWALPRPPKRGQGRLEAKSYQFDEELQLENATSERHIFDFRGGQEGPPGLPQAMQKTLGMRSRIAYSAVPPRAWQRNNTWGTQWNCIFCVATQSPETKQHLGYAV